MSFYKILAVSTSVGPLGTGLGGGVELTILNIVKELHKRGHQVEVVAPQGSVIDSFIVHEIEGNYQLSCQEQGRTAPITMPQPSILANMWSYAFRVQTQYDLIINFSYDWLPLYLTPFFGCPIAHLISMSSLTDAMDHIIEQMVTGFPGTVGVHSQVQAETFSFGNKLRYLLNGLDLSLYQFCDRPNNALAWVGRIAPEKGLEDAVQAANITGIPLKVFGLIQHEDYWQQICQTYPRELIDYRGFLPTVKLQEELGKCRAILMTPLWIEAFGNVVIEALACGVPVITYQRGGPAEIVRDGQTGFWVEPDSIAGLVNAIGRIDEIDRVACRRQAESDYSLTAFGDRFENWLIDILQSSKKNRTI